MNNSAYAMANERNRMRKNPDYPFSDPVKVAELQAVYYGMVEELDHWVGALLDELAAHPVTAQNTLIVFTSDHGDMLGAHSMVGKGTLLVGPRALHFVKRVWMLPLSLLSHALVFSGDSGRSVARGTHDGLPGSDTQWSGDIDPSKSHGHFRNGFGLLWCRTPRSIGWFEPPTVH